MGRTLLLLLVAVGGLQLYSLQRQADLSQELNRLRTRQMMLESQVGSMTTQVIQPENPEDRWFRLGEHRFTPTSPCTEAMVQLEWHLQEWTPDTKSSLAYRSRPGEPWQEAAVKPLGGGSHQATFWVPAKPTFQFGMDIEYSQGTAVSPILPSQQPTETEPGPQFQITAEIDGLTRSTEVKPVPGTERFTIPVKLRLQVGRDGRYSAQFSTNGPDAPPCQQIEQATVELIASDRSVMAVPFTAQANTSTWTADWQTKEPLTELLFHFRHAGGQERIPVRLPAR